MKVKIEELETNSKINNVRELYRGIYDFKKWYQPRNTIVKDEKGDLVANTHGIMARWRNYFSQLLNVHEVKDVRQAEIHSIEPLVPEPNAFEVELTIEKLRNHKSQGIDQIPAELIKQGVGQFAVIFINLLFLFGIRRNCLMNGRSRSQYLSIRRGIKQTVITIGGISLFPTTYKVLSIILLSRLIPYAEKVTGDHQCGFRRNRSTTDHIFCIR